MPIVRELRFGVSRGRWVQTWRSMGIGGVQNKYECQWKDEAIHKWLDKENNVMALRRRFAS